MWSPRDGAYASLARQSSKFEIDQPLKDPARSDAPTPDPVSDKESVSGLQKKLKKIWMGWTQLWG
jgi:hypothetical protein